MTHASTNAAWQDYPSTATLVTASTLEKIENTADALYTSSYGSLTRTRRATLNVYTIGSWAIPAATDTLLKNTITWVAFRDTEAKWFPNATASYYEIPYSGRLWDIYFHAPIAVSTNGGTLACKIMLNTTSVVVNSIISDSRNCGGGEAHAIAHRQGIPLNAGDKAYFGVWSSHAVTVGPSFGNVIPEIVIRDAGPA
ncbi:MAG TPA: hypothetical protein VD866_01555 [Urbifossiella sp.]|nr:hypothetical protein [Urbifossiella sp.]